MWCMKCNKDLGACICPDLQERLASLGQHPNLAMTYCSGCGEYHSRCKCSDPKPEREMRSEGKIIARVPPQAAPYRLERWSVFDDADPYRAPEDQAKRLQGYVYGNPRFEEGEHVYTTAIVGIAGGLMVTRSGSRYELGEVDPAYEKLYPNAKERLLASVTARLAA